MSPQYCRQCINHELGIDRIWWLGYFAKARILKTCHCHGGHPPWNSGTTHEKETVWTTNSEQSRPSSTDWDLQYIITMVIGGHVSEPEWEVTPRKNPTRIGKQAEIVIRRFFLTELLWGSVATIFLNVSRAYHQLVCEWQLWTVASLPSWHERNSLPFLLPLPMSMQIWET